MLLMQPCFKAAFYIFTMVRFLQSHCCDRSLSMYQELLNPIHNFLKCTTPDAWIEEAKKPENVTVILRDHLLCELKASQSAMFLLKRYVLDKNEQDQLTALMQPYEDFAYRGIGSLESLKNKNALSKTIQPKTDCPYGLDMIDKLVLLIKEELHHFYQVLEIIKQQGMQYRPISAGRYAKGLIREVTSFEPDALIDKLIIGAIIEARSCERFAGADDHPRTPSRRDRAKRAGGRLCLALHQSLVHSHAA